MSRTIQSTAKELSQNGYKVMIAPLRSDLPFDLGEYQPDLIAMKENESVVLDVKTSSNSLPVDQIQAVVEQIASHPGWRFMLVTLDDVNEQVLPSNNNDLPSWNELSNKLSSLNKLIQDSLLEPALLFSWSIIEAVLRKRAIKQDMPVWNSSPQKILSHLFSNGEISLMELELFIDCLAIRNKVAHGIQASIDPEMLKSANHSIHSLVAQWSQEALN
jgi:Holliday junction resolvase